MNVNYSYQITVNFELTDEKFDLLTEAMQHHNDCEGATKLGEFWYGNMNRNRWKKEEGNTDPYFYSATTRQLDTKVIKALEPFVNYTLGNKIKQAAGASLYFELMKVLSAAINHSNELHTKQQLHEQN